MTDKGFWAPMYTIVTVSKNTSLILWYLIEDMDMNPTGSYPKHIACY